MNTQPNTFTWNLMGMMNNCVYRVKIHPSVSKGGLALRYEHPTIAGAALGGWMNRADAQKPPAEEVHTFTWEENMAVMQRGGQCLQVFHTQ